MTKAIFRTEELTVRFDTPDGEVQAVSGLNLEIAAGETVAIVGESGSGKSQTFLSVMGLLAKNGRVNGKAVLEDRDLLAMSQRELDIYRGRDISMVFQDPMTGLNPSLKISRQLTETLEVHQGCTRREADERAIAMLESVGIPDPKRRFKMYPHELSGGMRQRVMIAMALLCEPKLLVADEPTTALDVTIQAQILELFAELKARLNTALVLISHDLGVVAGLADRVFVMYAGRVVEEAFVDELFEDPKHPYTKALLASTPRIDTDLESLESIPGRPPNLQRLPKGCAFAARCGFAEPQCRETRPPLTAIAMQRTCACLLVKAEEKEPA